MVSWTLAQSVALALGAANPYRSPNGVVGGRVSP